MLFRSDPADPSAIVVQDVKGERFFGVPLVHDVPAVADHDALCLGAKETAAFNRVAKARYSELAAKWVPKGRPVIVDAQARETARNMEAARASGRAQFKRNLVPRPVSRPASEDPSLAEFLPDVGRGNSLREVQNFLGGES